MTGDQPNTEASRSTEQESTECCPTCNGSGRIEKIPERKFSEGQSVIWYCGPQKFKATVKGYSKSGKRIRIKGDWGSTYVSPLSIREAT